MGKAESYMYQDFKKTSEWTSVFKFITASGNETQAGNEREESWLIIMIEEKLQAALSVFRMQNFSGASNNGAVTGPSLSSRKDSTLNRIALSIG
jgi:hypothetical protein